MKYENIQKLFQQAVETFGSNIAIDCVDKQLTYAELGDTVNNLASCLISAGASKGSIVAILAQDPADVIAAIIGVLQAGCVFVPFDPDIPEKRLQAMVSKAAPEWFVIESRFIEKTSAIWPKDAPKAKVICLDGPPANGDRYNNLLQFDRLEHPGVKSPTVLLDPSDMCYIFFTSGSTGQPKGIAGQLAGINHFVKWETDTFDVGEGTRVSQLTTPSFDAIMRDIFVPLCTGGTVCAPPGKDTIWDARKLSDWIDRQNVHLVHCVPSLFRSIVNEPLDPKAFSSLRYILMAGEPLLPADVKKWTEVYGERVQLVNLYGPSETTMVKLFYFVQRSDQDRPSIPIGKPMKGAKALVLDTEGKPCPPGVIGEIYIRTPFRTLGYYGQPELTKEVFVQNPFNQNPDDVIYKTGDLGRVLEDGNFEFLGRKDRQVKVRGVRVELEEIESLLRDHGSVKDVAVVNQQDLNGSEYLCAYVVLDPAVESDALGDFLSAYLPGYMVPSVIMPLDALPRTISGKVDRRALPVPSSLQPEERATPYVAPRTPIEEKLADMWSQLLGVECVGIHNRFFDLGGHSLLATQALSRVREAFGVEVPLGIFLDTPTIANLALVIIKTQAEQEDDEAIARAIEEIKQLSDEALESLLENGQLEKETV